MNKVILNGTDLKIEDVVNVARKGYEVEIDKTCMAHIAEVRKYMEDEWMREDAPAVYGFNTGLGKHKVFLSSYFYIEPLPDYEGEFFSVRGHHRGIISKSGLCKLQAVNDALRLL
jgi:hypothetical protein